MRKVLSFVLVLTLVLSSFSFAFAAEVDSEIIPIPEDVEDTSYETAVQVLMALDVVTGYEDGTYKPGNAVTRAEMAALIVRVLGLADSADYMRASSFSDMAGHWADKYVAVMAGKNIVNGYPDGSFQPDVQVSFPEAITMVVRALGYIDGCEDLVGSWPVNYVSLADDLDITDDTDVILSGAADRGAVAQMIYNSLAVANVSVDSDMSVSLKGEEGDRVTFLTKLDCYLDEDVVIDPDIVGDEDETLIDLTDYVYADVDVYRLDDGDDPIIAVDDVNSDIVAGEFDLDATMNDSTVTDADDDDYTLDGLATDTAVYLNGAEADFQDVDGLLDGFDVTVYGEFDEDDDDIFATISGIVAVAPTAQVAVNSGDVDDIEDAIDDGNGEIFNHELPTIDNDGDDLDMANIIVTGDVDSLEDIEADDIVTIYASGDDVNSDSEYDKIKFVVTRETAEIKVKKISGDDIYDTDGNKYDLSADKNDQLDLDGDQASALDIGSVYDVYFDEFGYIYMADEIDSTPDLYGIVVDFIDADGFDDPQIKLFTNDGDTVIFEADEDDIDDATILTGGNWASIATGDAVSYSLNSSDTIDEMEVVIADASTTDTGIYSEKSDKWSRNSLDSGLVVFDVSDDTTYDIVNDIGDDADWGIIDELQDDDEYGAYYYENSDGDIEVMIVLSKTSDDSEYFAINTIYEVKDGDDEKLELEGFLGETATTEITVDRNVVSTEAFVYVVNYDGSEVDEATMVRTDGALNSAVDYGFGYGTVTDTDSYGFDEDDAYAGDFADDVIVYVQVFDDNEPDAIEVGDTGDIDRDDFVIYTYNDDGDIEMVVVVDEDDIDDYNAYMDTI